jgi:phage-related protein
MNSKVLRWMGSSYRDLNSLPAEARRKLGYQLGLVQLGYEPHDWKPFETVGSSAREIRVRIDNNQYRSIYVAKFEEAIYVLHCFVKKEEQTSKHDVEIAKLRYKEVVRLRSLP